MKSDGRIPVAIVGGGYSGTILAAKLARRGINSLLIDGSGRAGHGVAYSTTEPAHLLNVRAEAMSAWADEPDHFAKHFEAHGGHRRGFAPRRLFGGYLRAILEHVVGGGHTHVDHCAAVDARWAEGEWLIELADRRAVTAEALVLALGNQEPDPLSDFAAAGERYINNPWAAAAQAAVCELAATGEDALLVGTGLTMVDLALSLDAAGHTGRAIALSRRGQIPRAHDDYAPAPVELSQVPRGKVLALSKWLRRRSAEVGWPAAVDSLRPYSHKLWQSFARSEQQRFLRHARPWWDVHRHRIAPEVMETLQRMIEDGRLEIVAGRIIRVRQSASALQISIRRRGQNSVNELGVAYAFNCTGPLHSIERTRDPLLRRLLDRGTVTPDHLGVGADVDERSRVEGAHRLWALGPLTKGRYWEIVAVPDIREQAAAVAADIARELEA